MTITVHSKKRARTYERKFDYAKAKRMRKRGLSYSKIAQEMGVSTTAIQRALDPQKRELMEKHSKTHVRKNRQPCKGGCGTLVWMHTKTYPTKDGERERSGFCRECLKVENAKGQVREDEILCTSCGEWKEDEEFPKSTRDESRRWRRHHCIKCETEARGRRRRAAGGA